MTEGKLPPDEPAVLPPLPVASREERRKGGNVGYITPQSSKRLKHEREWDVDLMPPPGSNKKNSTATYVEPDQPIDPNEPTYCICHQVPCKGWMCYLFILVYFILVDLYWEFGLLRCRSFPGVIWWHDCLRQWECKLSYLSMIYELDPRHTLILRIYRLGVYYADIMPVAFCTALYQY